MVGRPYSRLGGGGVGVMVVMVMVVVVMMAVVRTSARVLKALSAMVAVMSMGLMNFMMDDSVDDDYSMFTG